MATLLIVLSAATSNANATLDSLYVEPQCKLFSVDDRQFRMIYAAAAQQNIQLQLKDHEGRLLYKSNVSSEGFAKDFDLSFLPDGDYTFVLKSGDYKYEESVSVSQAAAQTAAQARFQASQLMLVEVEGDAYALVGTNQSGAKLAYSLNDDQGNALYTGTYASKEEIKDLFTFRNVQGDVTLQFFLEGSLVDERVLALK
ncbi:MAG: hypothetical protein NXI00_24625 [Cytophagales bacterium]|nr:hypothetical protein [Cytophagales bacterium]